MFTFFCEVVFVFKQKTAYEMRISDWSSDVCSSDLPAFHGGRNRASRRSCRARRGRIAPGRRRVFRRRTKPLVDPELLGELGAPRFPCFGEIGRASCREKVCQYG